MDFLSRLPNQLAACELLPAIAGPTYCVKRECAWQGGTEDWHTFMSTP